MWVLSFGEEFEVVSATNILFESLNCFSLLQDGITSTIMRLRGCIVVVLSCYILHCQCHFMLVIHILLDMA